MRRLIACIFFLTPVVLWLLLSVPTGPPPAEAGTVPDADKGGAKITFEKLVHDFGEISSKTSNTCEFKFTNTGNSLLKIGEIKCPCGCTAAELAKKEYVPGESGAVKVTYRASSGPATIAKSCTVPSNDKSKPVVVLGIKAEIALKVEHKPERLNLLLRGKNAGCPEITLTSLDKQPFAITGFKSTGESITAEYDPLEKKTKFALKPKVDITKLRKGMRGRIEISLTHPECEKVGITFDTVPEFKMDPRVLYIPDVEPEKQVTKEVRVLSNYNEDFEVESTSCKKGTVKVLTQKKVESGYQFELQMTPPAVKTKRAVFTDVFYVKVKGGPQLQVTCWGRYAKQSTKPSGK
jgi:hypothetical protein